VINHLAHRHQVASEFVLVATDITGAYRCFNHKGPCSRLAIRHSLSELLELRRLVPVGERTTNDRAFSARGEDVLGIVQQPMVTGSEPSRKAQVEFEALPPFTLAVAKRSVL
jgi:hypothetical protein